MIRKVFPCASQERFSSVTLTVAYSSSSRAQEANSPVPGALSHWSVAAGETVNPVVLVLSRPPPSVTVSRALMSVRSVTA